MGKQNSETIANMPDHANRADTGTARPVQELEAIMNGLAESVCEASTDELLAESREDGRDPGEAAAEVRQLLLRAVDRYEKSIKKTKSSSTSVAAIEHSI